MTTVISGASRGIGLSLVKKYLQAKHEVFALCRNPAAAGDLKNLQENYSDLSILPSDTTDYESILKLKSFIGDKPVDLLLNVAGTLHMERTPEDIDFDAWKDSMEVMAIGPIRMLTALLPNLQAAHGKVVSISSQVGASDWTGGGFYSYGAAKAALNRAMKSLAVDLEKRGVAVAVVHPGYVQTDMTGHNGDLTPDESASGIKQVADQLDLETTGQFFNWNGTRHAW